MFSWDNRFLSILLLRLNIFSQSGHLILFSSGPCVCNLCLWKFLLHLNFAGQRSHSIISADVSAEVSLGTLVRIFWNLYFCWNSLDHISTQILYSIIELHEVYYTDSKSHQTVCFFSLYYTHFQYNIHNSTNPLNLGFIINHLYFWVTNKNGPVFMNQKHQFQLIF